MTHICVVKLTIIGSDNGLSPGRRQAIIWTNAGILVIRPLGTNFSEILIGIQTFLGLSGSVIVPHQQDVYCVCLLGNWEQVEKFLYQTTFPGHLTPRRCNEVPRWRKTAWLTKISHYAKVKTDEVLKQNCVFRLQFKTTRNFCFYMFIQIHLYILK